MRLNFMIAYVLSMDKERGILFDAYTAHLVANRSSNIVS
jgi:hypothetical protein